MSLIRVRRTTRQTLTQELRVDGVLTDASGTLTCTTRRLDGTLVDTAAAGHPSIGTYTYAPPEQALLDTLTVDWTGTLAGSPIASLRDYVEVVGGFMFGTSELRTRHSLSSAYSEAALAETRTEVEQECERICGQSFTPRFARVALGGSGVDTVVLPRMNVRAVRAATVDGVSQLAAVEWAESGVLTMPGGVWPAGRRNVIVEFEYGWDLPPEYIRTAGMLRAKTLLSQPKSGVPARAASFTVADGGVYRLSLPTRESTGIPEVDGAYAKETVALDLGGWL